MYLFNLFEIVSECLKKCHISLTLGCYPGERCRKESISEHEARIICVFTSWNLLLK